MAQHHAFRTIGLAVVSALATGRLRRRAGVRICQSLFVLTGFERP